MHAVGAYFFNTDEAGDFLRRGVVTVEATDADGSVTRFKTHPLETNYFGFVSDTTLSSLTVSKSAWVTAFPTVDNLTLAAAVPEPESYALLLCGLGVVSLVASRCRKER